MLSRRLGDAIATAHKIACEEEKKEIAQLLIEALELELTRIGGEQQDRREVASLIEAAFDQHENTFGPITPSDMRSTP